MVGQPLQPGAARGTVHGLRLVRDVLCKGCAAFHAVQILECTQPQASIGGNVCHAHFLPGAGAFHALCHVVSKAQFTSTQEQQPPCLPGAWRAGACCSGLALFVCQHVGTLARCLWVNLCQFVKDQQAVAVLGCNGLKGVISGPPPLQIACAAVHAGCQL